MSFSVPVSPRWTWLILCRSKAQTELNTNALSEEQLNTALQDAAEVTRSRLQVNRAPLSRNPTLQSVAGALDGAGPGTPGEQLREEMAEAGQSWEAQEQAYKNFRVLMAKEERKETAAKVGQSFASVTMR